MPASINDLGNITIISLLLFLALSCLGAGVPFSLFLCHIVVIVASAIAGN